MHASDLFLFVGAGASRSAPSGLPLFEWIRDEILRQLGLDEYLEKSPNGRISPENGDRVAVARGLAPEPFMSALEGGDIDLEGWLGIVLRGRPNAAHQTIAALAAAGARVWSVNFDTLIERSRPALSTLAWPSAPVGAADLVKPHGTLPGPLIVGSEQVIAGLPEDWRDRLRADVTNRLVVFLGYSGRDLDFQPIWNEILEHATGVLWFEQPSKTHPTEVADESMKRRMLRHLDGRGDLAFARASEHLGASPNASWDFVDWCRTRGLAPVDAALQAQLLVPMPRPCYPPLGGELGHARARVLDQMGDFNAARRTRQQLLRKRGQRMRAARALGRGAITNGGSNVAALLALGRLIPPVSKGAGWRETAERKRLTALHRQARHEAVLHGTRNLDPSAVSTYLILRASAVRALGSLDEAAEVADAALRLAHEERHEVRIAHAAFQKAMALTWAGRVSEARSCLEDELMPNAAVAANRWVAWGYHIDGCLKVQEHDWDAALDSFGLGETLFRAEALLDGVVSVGIARLAARRGTGDDAAYQSDLDALAVQQASRGGRLRYYARGSLWAQNEAELQRAEYARVHLGDRAEACAHYTRLSASRHPLHSSIGHLGLALVETSVRVRNLEATKARSVSLKIGARLVAERAERLIAGDAEAEAEFYFC